jgi:hypothetical protein
LLAMALRREAGGLPPATPRARLPARLATGLVLAAAAAAAFAALPPVGRDLLRGQAVELAAGGEPGRGRWRRPVRWLRVESLLTDAAALPAGTEVGVVELMRGERMVRALPLRVGVETAEWAAERGELRGRVPQAPSRISWLPPPGDAFAHAYRATWRFPHPEPVHQVRVRPAPGLPPGAALVLRRLEVAR